MHSAIPICKRECCTAELRSLNFHGEKGQGCLRNDIDHGLIVPDTVTDHVIKTVTVSDVHAIEIESVRISGQLLNAVQCLDTGEVDAGEHKHGGKQCSQNAAEENHRSVHLVFSFLVLVALSVLIPASEKS